MSSIVSTFRYTLRRLFAKNPASTVVAIVAMALGVALTTTMFSVVDGFFLRGLPFEDQDEIVHLETNNLERDIQSMEVTQHDFEIWREELDSYEGLAGNHGGTFNLSEENQLPERFDGTWISANFFELVGVEPALGRGFRADEEEPGAPGALIISHQVWQQRYGGADDVVGREVRVNAEPATIVGVAPEDFEFPVRSDLWMPLQLETHATPRSPDAEIPTLEVFGRLRDGVSLDEAAVELDTITKRLAAEYPETNEGVGGVVKPYTEEYIGDGERTVLGVMFVAVLLVLFIACFNVANLLIGRASLRSRELAIRTALGSGRWRVVGHVLAESGAIAVLGGTLGVVLASFGTRAMGRAIETAEPPFWVQIELGPRSLLFALAAIAVSSFLAGFVPALQASRPDVTEVLQDQGRGSTSFRLGWVTRTLVVLEVTFSAAILIAAGLAIRSVLLTQAYEHPFDSSKILMGRAGLFEAQYAEEEWEPFFEEVRQELLARPEVESATVSLVMPAETEIGAGYRTRYERPGETYDEPFQMPLARYVSITPDYFRTLGVSVVTGRDFDARDRADSPRVALVNQDFAQTEWPGENPIGKRINLWLGEEEEAEREGWVEVVGVVPNLRFAEFDDEDDQQGIYVPFAQEPARFAWVAVRTRSAPAAFTDTLRRTVLEVDPDLPLYFVGTMDEALERTLFIPRLMGVLFSTFGLVALVLACVGLYGVMAFAVSQRVQEMGVRMALGARRRDVLTLILGQGMKQVAIGLVVGLGLGFGLSKVLDGIFYAVGAGDPKTFIVIPVILTAVAFLALVLPARRASRVDPMVALRYE